MGSDEIVAGAARERSRDKLRKERIQRSPMERD